MTSGLFKGKISLECVSGISIERYIPDLARLRIEVFREFPYLYAGDIEYEKKYLETYLKSPRSLVVLAKYQDQVVGASTALPLIDEADYVKEAFTNSGIDINQIFYFGESVLNTNMRGQGIGKSFFDLREKHALSFSEYKITCFCAVQRNSNHPLQPTNYKPLDPFWQSRGYKKNSHLQSQFSWMDIGQTHETLKPMIYWTKEWC